MPLIINGHIVETIVQGGQEACVIQTNGCYGLATITPGHVSTDNSYVGTLASGESFIGVAEDVVNHGVISIIINSTQDSAINGFVLEFSLDGINWFDGDNYTIYKNIAKIFSFQCASKYYRISFTNGADGDAILSLQTILKPYYVKPSSHRIGDVISSDDDAELVKSVLTAQIGDGDFVPIKASKSGNLQITDAESGLAIAMGSVIGASDINKFGNAPDFGTTDGEINIWDGAEDGTAWEQMKYIFSTTDAIDSVSSSNASDTGIEVFVQGLDINYNLVNQTVTLLGQTRVPLTTPLLRVFRAYNNNGVEFVGHVVIYENTALTAGVPTDKTKIKAIIQPENQQTEMVLYTIPAGFTGYLISGYASSAGASKDTSYIIRFKSRLVGKVFRLQQKISITDNGSSFVPFEYKIPQVYPEKTDLIVTAEMTALGANGGSVSSGFALILKEN